MYGDYGPKIGNVRSKWEVTEAREIDLGPDRARRVLPDALFTATGATVIDAESGSPRVELRRAMSVFDACTMTAAVEPIGEERSRIEATVTFDVSDARLDAVLMLTTSVVGIPVSLAWRAASIRSSRKYARATLDALWKALDDLTRGPVYR